MSQEDIELLARLFEDEPFIVVTESRAMILPVTTTYLQ